MAVTNKTIMLMRYELEIIAFTIESCAVIESAGAIRVELCDNPGEGGTTPSYGMIKKARQILGIDLFPMIRPRGGDFVYNEMEFEIMKQDILICKALGCDGVVSGILEANGTIDKDRTSALVHCAYPMEFTFHRAFDRVAHMETALEDLIQCGCTRVLTSGLYATAEEGLQNISQLVAQANHRIAIMPGAGIRSGNIESIIRATGATQIHSSARSFIRSKSYTTSAFTEPMDYITADRDEIIKMKNVLHQLSVDSITDRDS